MCIYIYIYIYKYIYIYICIFIHILYIDTYILHIFLWIYIWMRRWWQCSRRFSLRHGTSRFAQTKRPSLVPPDKRAPFVHPLSSEKGTAQKLSETFKPRPGSSSDWYICSNSLDGGPLHRAAEVKAMSYMYVVIVVYVCGSCRICMLFFSILTVHIIYVRGMFGIQFALWAIQIFAAILSISPAAGCKGIS